MRTRTSSGPQLRRKGSRDALNRLANIVDKTVYEGFVVALRQHSDQGLGSGFANDQAPATLEFGFGGDNALADPVRLQRSGSAVEADVLEELRDRVAEGQDLDQTGVGW